MPPCATYLIGAAVSDTPRVRQLGAPHKTEEALPAIVPAPLVAVLYDAASPGLSIQG